MGRMHLKCETTAPQDAPIPTARVGRYFDILIYRDIFNCDYRIEGRNLSDDISKLSSWSKTIVILLRMCT